LFPFSAVSVRRERTRQIMETGLFGTKINTIPRARMSGLVSSVNFQYRRFAGPVEKVARYAEAEKW